MNQENTKLNKVQQPIIEAPTEVRIVIEKVLKLEKDKLYHKNLRHINDDILKIIKDVVK